MTDDTSDGVDGLTARMRELVAARERREQMWKAGEYPRSAYDAVRLLIERVEPPKRYADGWREHVEMSVREVVEEEDARNADTIAAAVEPELRKTSEALSKPSPLLGFVDSMRPLSDALGSPAAPLYSSPLRDVPPVDMSPVIEARRAAREREEQMVEALNVLVGFQRDEAAKSAHDRAWLKASVIVGVLGIVTAIVIAVLS